MESGLYGRRNARSQYTAALALGMDSFEESIVPATPGIPAVRVPWWSSEKVHWQRTKRIIRERIARKGQSTSTERSRNAIEKWQWMSIAEGGHGDGMTMAAEQSVTGLGRFCSLNRVKLHKLHSALVLECTTSHMTSFLLFGRRKSALCLFQRPQWIGRVPWAFQIV